MKEGSKRIGTRFVLWSVLLLTVGCEEDVVVPPPTSNPAEFAFVTTSDFQTGSASVIWLDGQHSTKLGVAPIHGDAVARYFDGLIYVVNRFGGDNIQVINPGDGFAPVRQFSVAAGSDPHDIAVVSPTKAYVTRYNSTEIWIVNPSTGTQTGAIDLAALADGDGIPEIDHMTKVGDSLFVTVQRIDRNTPGWDPVGLSYMAVIDVTTDALVDTDPNTSGVQPISLAGTNPFSDIVINPATGTLCVANVGKWGAADGGVETINPITLASEGIVFSGATINGDITDVVIVTASQGYVIFTDASFNNTLQGFNPLTGAAGAVVYAPGGFVLQDVELSPMGQLFLTDRTATKPGIRIYDAGTGTEMTTDPVDVGLPPFSITFGVVQ
jgi:hypothetical protein